MPFICQSVEIEKEFLASLSEEERENCRYN
jgi:hypothetical protein